MKSAAVLTQHSGRSTQHFFFQIHTRRRLSRGRHASATGIELEPRQRPSRFNGRPGCPRSARAGQSHVRLATAISARSQSCLRAADPSHKRIGRRSHRSHAAGCGSCKLSLTKRVVISSDLVGEVGVEPTTDGFSPVALPLSYTGSLDVSDAVAKRARGTSVRVARLIERPVRSSRARKRANKTAPEISSLRGRVHSQSMHPAIAEDRSSRSRRTRYCRR